MFETVMILAAARLLAVVEFPVTEGRGCEIVIFLARAFSDFDRSDPIIFYFAGTGIFSLLGSIGHDLMTNKFAEAGKVEGHRVVAFVGLDIIGRVADAVVGIRIADTLGSTRGFSTTLTFIVSCLFGEFCVSSLFPS